MHTPMTWASARAAFWETLDSAAHALRLPGRGWICDQYDLALGLTSKEVTCSGAGAAVPGTFTCPHMTISGVTGASCPSCGPLARAAA